MNVSLTAELDDYVTQKVESGFYSSASEVVREGLRLLKDQDDLKMAQMAKLGREIDVASEQIERGEYSEFAADDLPDLAATLKAEGRRRRTGKAVK